MRSPIQFSHTTLIEVDMHVKDQTDCSSDEEEADRSSPTLTYKVEWDEKHDEPFIQVRPGFRLTPFRPEDWEGMVSERSLSLQTAPWFR